MVETPRKQKEKRILDLHNDGCTIRDIAKQEHKSFRDIGAIINRQQERQETIERQAQQAHIASEAYGLFSKGKSLVEVAIELKLRQPDVQTLHGEYLKLIGLEKLHKVYEEVEDNIENFVNLYNMIKASGITPPHVERLVRIANDDLPSVERRFQLANNRVAELQGDIRNSTFTFQGLSDGISSMNAAIRSLGAEKQKMQEEIDELYQKRMKLQAFFRDFENNNERYLQITKFAEEKVHRILSENKLFLRLAVQSLIELIANDPGKYEFLIGSAREKNLVQLLDEHYNDTSAYNSMVNSSSSSHMNETPPALTNQTKQKADGEEQRLLQLQQLPLLLNDGLEMLVQEAEKNLLNNLVIIAPTIIALLMLTRPKSRHSLSLAPEEPKTLPFEGHRQEGSRT
jgi:hypothetical protein